jgi:O-antigen/teichoic acid export membrane protein
MTAPVDEQPPAGSSNAHVRLGNAGRGSILNLAGAAVSAGSGFALTIVLARVLSRTDAGVFFSATALFLLATSVGQLGTSTGLVYFVSRAGARGAVELLGPYMRAALRPVVAVAVVMGLVLEIWAWPIARVMGPGHAPDFVAYLRVLALFIPLAAIGNVSLSGTRGLGTMRPTAFLDQMTRATLQLVLVCVVLVASAYGLVVWAWSVPYLLLAVLGRRAWVLLTRDKPAAVTGRVEGLPGEFWRFTAPRAVSSVAQVAMQRFDIILVGAIAGVPQAAVYAATTRFLALGQLAGGAISQAVQPQLGASLAHRNHGEVRQLYAVATGWLVLLTWPMYLTFIVFGPVILSVFGRGYGAGTSTLLVLSLSMLVATACGMVDMVLLMAGKSSWNLYNVLAAFATNLGLDLLLVPHLGILGAALGWAVAILVANLLPLSQVFWSTRVHPFGVASMAAMGSALVCFLAIPLGARLVVGASWGGLFMGVVLGGLCYLGFVWVLRRPLQLAALTSRASALRSHGGHAPS